MATLSESALVILFLIMTRNLRDHGTVSRDQSHSEHDYSEVNKVNTVKVSVDGESDNMQAGERTLKIRLLHCRQCPPWQPSYRPLSLSNSVGRRGQRENNNDDQQGR